VTVWVDGVVVGDRDVPVRTGIAPFETMGAVGGELPLWDLHLARLRAAAQRLGLPFAPAPSLRGAAGELLLANGRADGVLRVALVPAAGRMHTAMSVRARSPVTVVRLLPTIVQRPADAPPGDLKAEPRRFHNLVRQQAQDGEADDGIVVDHDGAVLEASLGNLWLRIDGIWTTPALDGRVLPGIARALLLGRAASAGLRVAERACDLADLHRATALAHSNAVHGPRPAALVGGRADVAIVDSELGALWRAATTR
jgi:branched-subunit amino acid aminotransferase/4-amino-4-deoxychorismate lyase